MAAAPLRPAAPPVRHRQGIIAIPRSGRAGLQELEGAAGPAVREGAVLPHPGSRHRSRQVLSGDQADKGIGAASEALRAA